MSFSPFNLQGVVKPSSQRGRTLGFPTANLETQTLDALDGVYFAYITWNNVKSPALLFIGSAITFGETERKVEVYVLGDDAPSYGDKTEVEVLAYHRANERFASADDLVKQMKLDEQAARDFFAAR